MSKDKGNKVTRTVHVGGDEDKQAKKQGIRERLGIAGRQQADIDIDKAMSELPVAQPNRAQKRERLRSLKKTVAKVDGLKRMTHPFEDLQPSPRGKKPRLTPYGAKEMKRRRAAAKRAKASRKTNQRVACERRLSR